MNDNAEDSDAEDNAAELTNAEDSEAGDPDCLVEFPRLVAIPPIFHSLGAGGPFQRCLNCETLLLETETEYSIEIVFQRTEPIIEMAICHKCRSHFSGQVSAESLQQIEDYVQSRVDFVERYRRLLSADEDYGMEPWIDECLFTQTRREDSADWQIYGTFVGNKMQLGVTPLMISGVASREMSELLSETTKGWMTDFIGDFFGMPPEFCDSPDWSPIFL